MEPDRVFSESIPAVHDHALGPAGGRSKPPPIAETGRPVAFQQSSENRRIGRITANDAMRTELEHIADPSDRSGWVGLERPLLQPIGSGSMTASL